MKAAVAGLCFAALIGCGADPDLRGSVGAGTTTRPTSSGEGIEQPPGLSHGFNSWEAVSRHRFYQRLWWDAVTTWRAHAVWGYVQSLRLATVIASRDVRRVEPDTGASAGGGACGGSLPPCSVLWCESRGDPQAENPSSSASGRWQILDSTWNGFGGYAHAADAPVSVQDAKARLLYDGGRGRSQWSC